MAKRAKKTYDVYWSPEGRKIATVEASTAKAAKGKAPLPYRKHKGEMYVKEVGNPRKVAGKSTTLRNMAFVSITKQRNGVVKITGRKMAPKRNPHKEVRHWGPSEYAYQRKTGASKRMALAKAAGMYKRNPRKRRKQR